MSNNAQKRIPHTAEDDVAIYVEPSKRALVSIALLVVVFGCNFSFRSFGIALPHIIAKWNAMELYTLGASLMSVAMMVSTIIVARIAPRTGLKVTIVFGLVLLLVCNMLTLVVPNMLFFIILRVLTGVGNGIICGQMAASMNKLWPTSKRGIWMGILGIFQSFTSVIGPTLAGALVDGFGWQSTFIVISLFQVIGLIMFVLICPKDTKDRFYKPGPFDTAGTVTFSLMVTALVLVASYGNSLGWTNIKILIGFAVAIAALFALINVENKAEAAGTALLPWNLFRKDRNFVKIFAIAFFVCVLGMGQTYFMSLYLQKVAKTTAIVAGIPFTILSVGSLIAAPIAGRIIQKTGKVKGLMVVTAIMMTLPILFYGFWISPAVVKSAGGMTVLFAASFIYGLGYILTMTLPYNACSEYLPVESIGVATANVYMAINLGGSVGLAVLQAIYNAINKSAGMDAALKVVFICCAVGGVMALLLSMSLKKAVMPAVAEKAGNVLR